MSALRQTAAAALAALALAGCGSRHPTPDVPETLPPPGDPIVGLAPGVFTWVDFPDSTCDDGSPTGIAVSPGTSPDLVVALDGGGACWDYFTCYVLNSASHGPFGAAEFSSLLSTSLPGSILDRSLPGNPYKDASLVFVPYCTGDIHGGRNVAVYTAPGDVRTHHHMGHANVIAFLRRLAATFPAPRRLVVAGGSAGGFGAVVNYDTFRRYWPDAQGFMVDDSGPPLEPGAVPQVELDAWYASWRLDLVLDPLCGPACRTGLSPAFEVVAARYPSDRLGLLSSLEDAVISGYFLLSGPLFEFHLLKLAGDVFDPRPNARYFFVPGTSHTMLLTPASFEQGVPLLTWLGQQLGGDPAWPSQKP